MEAFFTRSRGGDRPAGAVICSRCAGDRFGATLQTLDPASTPCACAGRRRRALTRSPMMAPMRRRSSSPSLRGVYPLYRPASRAPPRRDRASKTFQRDGAAREMVDQPPSSQNGDSGIGGAAERAKRASLKRAADVDRGEMQESPGEFAGTRKPYPDTRFSLDSHMFHLWTPPENICSKKDISRAP